MTRSVKTHLRIVAVVCVVLGLFVPTILPFANSSNNSNPIVLANIPSDKKTGEVNMFATIDPTKRLASLSSTQEAFNICLQDETTRDTLQINSTTGAYKYTRCSDRRMLEGIGTLTAQGCTITLQDFGGIRRVLAKVDTCVRSATASIRISATVDILNATITDQNIANNTCDCIAPPPPPTPPPPANVNLSVGPPSLVAFGSCPTADELFFVSVPLKMQTLRSNSVVNARFHLLLNDQIIKQGELQAEGSGSSDCTIGSGICGTCPPVCNPVVLVTTMEGEPFIVGGPLLDRRCVTPECLGEAGCSPDGGTFCACGIVLSINLGAIPRRFLIPGRRLTFVIDPANEVPEFNESDNTATLIVP
jgi:hypothetical protein